jgi:hypothetical protein
MAEIVHRALQCLEKSEEGNEAIIQAATYLRSVLVLLEAPDPPTDVIWDLVGRAADISGLAQFFFGLFIGLYHA